MADRNKRLLLCDCLRSMRIDGEQVARACGLGQAPAIGSHLCRAQIETFKDAARDAAAAGGSLVVACTQEAPIFRETLDELGADAPAVFTNIRERAGWSEDGARAGPKIAALLAEAMVDIPPARSVTLESKGACLVYGRDEAAIEAARRLAPRLAAHVVLTGDDEILPPAAMDAPIFRGAARSARGRLGAFVVTFDGYAPYRVDSRRSLAFGEARDGAVLDFDLIVDLTGGAPLLPAPEKRDGYFHPDPGNPAAVQRALFDAVELVGVFEKPLYVDFKEDLCAHARSTLVGCSRCLDACPASAIAPDGDTVAIDPYVCGGCGACASVCPTGAAAYEMPTANALLERARASLGAYAAAGGVGPVLLIHDERRGEALIHLAARFGRGLPANAIPFVVNEVTQIGFDVLGGMLAYGAERVLILTPPERRDETAGLAGQAALANAVLEGLSFAAPRVEMIDALDPDALEAALWDLAPLEPIPPAAFLPLGGKRDLFRLALGHLHDAAPAPVDVVALPPGAPFGTVEVDAAGCTLCLACVGACPTGALQDDPDAPTLRFQEDACVQCGLCRTTCPERVIALRPRIAFAEEARQALVVKQEEPFHCVRCGKPFGTRASIERIVSQLADRHPMFKEGAMVDRIRMCEDCRVVDQANAADSPFAAGGPRRPRTTDDYLREEEEEVRAAREALRRGELDGADG